MKQFQRCIAVCISMLPTFLLGCTQLQVRKEQAPAPSDFYYESIRTQLRPQPIRLPFRTPYDGKSILRHAYLSGFTEGWEVMLDVWTAKIITPPQEFQEKDITDAWQEGFRTGQLAAYDRVKDLAEAQSESVEPPQQSPEPTKKP